MKSNNGMREDCSVLAVLYDEFQRTYQKSNVSLRCEIERLYQELYHCHLDNAEEVTAVFIGICDDWSRFAHEEGVKTGVRLALDLELDSMMMGGNYGS